MSVRCVGTSNGTLPTTTSGELTWCSTRMRRSRESPNRLATAAGSSPSYTSAVCTTTTTGAPPDRGLARQSKSSHEMSFAPRSVCRPLDAPSAHQLVAANESDSASSRWNHHASWGVREAGGGSDDDGRTQRQWTRGGRSFRQGQAGESEVTVAALEPGPNEIGSSGRTRTYNPPVNSRIAIVLLAIAASCWPEGRRYSPAPSKTSARTTPSVCGRRGGHFPPRALQRFVRGRKFSVTQISTVVFHALNATRRPSGWMRSHHSSSTVRLRGSG
jgi:hypothetical protein